MSPSGLHHTFDRVSVEAPWLEVDTSDGYEPELDRVVAFIGYANA
jgi:hypothetical protein